LAKNPLIEKLLAKQGQLSERAARALDSGRTNYVP
jgi:hypothetical protein